MNKRNNLIILIIVSVLSVILIIASTMSKTWLTPIRSAVGTVITPIQAGVNKLGTAIYDSLTNARTMDQLKQENAELQTAINDLILENTRLQEDNFELGRLRALYQLDQQYGKYEKVAARIIAKDAAGWFNIFTIDKGTDDGIKVDMNVIADGGLVGIVTEVGPNFATVRSIIDDSSKVSGMTMDSQYSCMVKGSLETYADGKLILSEILENSKIKEGDKIVTSNVSSKYLPGILIGYATDISVDANTLTQSGYLIPAAGFDTLREVLIITQIKQ